MLTFKDLANFFARFLKLEFLYYMDLMSLFKHIRTQNDTEMNTVLNIYVYL